jgi:hypothetical protein
MTFQAYLDNIKAKTGKDPEDFRVLAADKGLLAPGVKAGEIVAWLKADFALGHGHAMAIVGTITAADQPKTSREAELAKHFIGRKDQWRQPFDVLMDRAGRFGPDVMAQPGASYISLLRRGKKFAIVQTGANHLDVGIKLKDVEATERLGVAGSWNAMVTHRVRITEPVQFDVELLGWLRAAYDRA